MQSNPYTARSLVETAARIVAANPCDMQDSADLCIADARRLIETGRPTYALGRATKALAYAVGVFSPVYRAFDAEAMNLADEIDQAHAYAQGVDA